MKSAALVICACGASVQLMPPEEQKELFVSSRVTAVLTSAVRSKEVSLRIAALCIVPAWSDMFAMTHCILYLPTILQSSFLKKVSQNK